MAQEPINLYDYEARAQQVLSHNIWDFIDAGAMDQFTTRRNRSAFETLTLRPPVPPRHHRPEPVHYGLGRGDQSTGYDFPSR